MPGRTIEEALAESGYASKPTESETTTVDSPAAPAGTTDSPGEGPTPTPEPTATATDPVKDPPAPKPANNSELLKGIFGEEYGDEAKIKEAIAKSKRDFVSEIEDPEIRELVQATTGVNKISKQAYESWKKIGDLGKLSPSEKIALKMQMERGLSAEDAAFYVNNLYKFNVDLKDMDENHPDYAATKIAQIEGGEQARVADSWLVAKKEELSTPPTQMQLRKWEPQIPKLVAEHGKIEISTEGMDEKFIYPLNPKKVKEMESFLTGIVGNYTGFADPDSAEAKEWAKGAIQNQIFTQERDEIFKAYNGWLKAQELKKTVNPSGINNIPGEQALTPGKMTDADAYAAEKKKELAGVKN